MTKKLFKKNNGINRVVSNILSLGILQGGISLLPLLTVPYLVRVIGVDLFGLLAFANATIAYFNVITDFGFSLTATREVSLNRDDNKKIIEIFSSVLTIKLVLLLLSLSILIILGYIFPIFGDDFTIFILSFGLVLGQMIFPQWFFQGMEKMQYVTYFNIGAKIFYTLFIFILINKRSDYYLVPLLNSLSFIISGLISLVIINRKFKVKFKVQRLCVLKKYFKDSFKVFKGTFSYSAIAPTTIFLTGSFFGNLIVGYYSAVEKMIRGIAYLASPIAQAIFPFLAKEFTENPKKTLKISIKISLSFLILTLLISLFLGFNAETVLAFLYKEDFITSFTLKTYYIMLFFPPLYGIVHTYCTQNLLIIKKFDTYGYTLMSAFIFSLIIYFLLMTLIGKLAAPFTVVITELYIALTLIFFIIKYRREIV